MELMMIRIWVIITSLLFFLLLTSSAYAGGLNEHELDVINAAKETYEYNGVKYKLEQKYIDKLINYLSQDHIDLTKEDKDTILEIAYNNIYTGIIEGYLKPIDGQDIKTDQNNNIGKSSDVSEKLNEPLESNGRNITSGNKITSLNDINTGNNITTDNITAGNDIDADKNITADNNIIDGNDIDDNKSITTNNNIIYDNDIEADKNITADSNKHANNDIIDNNYITAGDGIISYNEITVDNYTDTNNGISDIMNFFPFLDTINKTDTSGISSDVNLQDVTQYTEEDAKDFRSHTKGVNRSVVDRTDNNEKDAEKIVKNTGFNLNQTLYMTIGIAFITIIAIVFTIKNYLIRK